MEGNPKIHDILNLMNIAALIVTAVWVFAFLRADVDRIREVNRQQTKSIETMQMMMQETYVRQDVFEQQYNRILETLNRIDRRLQEQANELESKIQKNK